jgi:hypothetical protein
MTDPARSADDVRAALGPPVEDFNPETRQFERVQHADPVRVVEDAFNIMPLALLVADGYSYTKGDMALIAVDALRAAGFAVVWAGEVVEDAAPTLTVWHHISGPPDAARQLPTHTMGPDPAWCDECDGPPVRSDGADS